MWLEEKIESLPGVGDKTAEILHKSGIYIVRDLLYYLPRTYDNYQTITSLKNLRPGKVVIRGYISGLSTRYTRRRNLSITEGQISDGTDAIKVVWFNQPYRAKQFDEKKEYFFTGEYQFSNGRYQLLSPQAKLASDVSDKASIVPVYPARGNFKSDNFARIFDKIRGDFIQISDLLPEIETSKEFTEHNARRRALFSLHFPETDVEIEHGRKVLSYEELFELLLAAAINKSEALKLRSESLPFNLDNIKAFLDRLSFSLTNAQKKAAWEIMQDMEKTVPMNRLLQGDVGSGKTVVAAMAALQAIKSGAQVAVLAPTSVLSSQHLKTFKELLEPMGARVVLLTGAEKNKDRIKQDLVNGKIDLVVGTHAILTDDTQFKNLRFCIIDEQHRFGVNQRQKLLLKSGGVAPHLLAMTATPIPRSLQLTVFGDLSVSIINEMPKGRQKVETKIFNSLEVSPVIYPAMKEAVSRGEQVYYICRLIEGKSESLSVKKELLSLSEIFPKFKIAALHGKMKPAEKDEILKDFSDGKIDILVSTTVVEVGVNVPNATIMVIRDADHYGLAQLHQLRGRVGRGQKKSYCYFVAEGDGNPSRRLRELENSNDGFYLAEVDLKLRGPGEIYGSLQHGALSLNIASISDTVLISRVQKDVKHFLPVYKENPQKYPELSSALTKYQQITTLN